MYNKYDLENLSTIVEDIRGNEYEFQNYFYNEKHQLFLNILHKKCGNVFTVSAYNFLKKKTNCTKCSKNKRLNQEDFEAKIAEITNNEYKVIGTFKNTSTKIVFKHLICGSIFEMLPENFIQGQRCPTCNPRRNKGELKFRKDFEKVSNGEYTLLSEYKNSRSNIKIKHNKCGHEYLVSANNFLQGHKCPKCFKGRHISKDDFNRKLLSLGFFNSHVLLSEFIGTKKKIKVKHLSCGAEFEITAGHLYKFPEVCPKCKKSYGEKRIEKFLLENNIIFESEKKFDKCIDKYRLPFDFYIESYNILIEYDGEQHFKPIFGRKEFEIIKKHDKIKDNFAKSGNYTLLRISYKDFNNIESILKATFKL